MKKYLIFSLLLIVACGPTEEEIQAQIDEAVEEAVEEVLDEVTTTTTTVPPTTTTSTTIPKNLGLKNGEIVGPSITNFEINYETISTEQLNNQKDIFTLEVANGSYFTNYIILVMFKDIGNNEMTGDAKLCASKFITNDNYSKVSFGCDWKIPGESLNVVEDGSYKIQYISIVSDFSGSYDYFKPNELFENSVTVAYNLIGFGQTSMTINCLSPNNKYLCNTLNSNKGVLDIAEFEKSIFYENENITFNELNNLYLEINN